MIQAVGPSRKVTLNVTTQLDEARPGDLIRGFAFPLVE